jgi:signal transduction histidine kinase
MARRGAVWDGLIALAVLVEMQVELSFVDAPRRDLLIARVAVLGLAAAVFVRRRLPVLAAALALGAVIGLESRGHVVSGNLAGPFFALLFVSHSIGAHAEGRTLWTAGATLLLGAVAAVRLDNPPGGLDDIFFATTVLTGGPLLLGRLVRARISLNRALHEKAVAAERDRKARAAGAVSEERARIAGELHEHVSSALATMIGQAGAAERLVRDNPTSPSGRSRRSRRRAATRWRRYGSCSACSAATTRSWRWRRSRRSPTSAT